VIGRFPGDTSCLSLAWAVPDRFISHPRNGATFTGLDHQHQPTEQPTPHEEVAAA
jgi:hypothetical protein